MDVGIMFSGGKDSTYAIYHAKQQGWNIKWLLSVKPTRTDCFLFHYAAVEHTPKIAEMLNIPHKLISCDVADPQMEADLVKNTVLSMPKVDAVVFGGTGLQLTQIGSVQKALQPHKIEVFAAHAGLEHEDVMRNMIKDGFEFMVAQVASDGLMQWLGTTITKNNLDKLFADSKKYGFHAGFEGGYADTFCTSGPLLGNKHVIIEQSEKVVEDQYCGHIIIHKMKIADKPILTRTSTAQLS